MRSLTIHITGRHIGFLLAGLAGFWLLFQVGNIVLILFVAMLLGVAIRPLVDRLAHYIPRAAAIVLLYLVLLAVIVAAVGLLVPILIDEITQLSAALPAIGQQILVLPGQWGFNDIPSLSKIDNDIFTTLSARLGMLATDVGGMLVMAGTAIATGLISILMVLVVGFFFTVDAHFAPRVIVRFFPRTVRATVATLAHDISHRLGQWVRAQILVSLCYGTALGIGLAVMQVPYALSLGVAGAILEVIPYVGGTFVTGLAMLVALLISPWLSLAVLVLHLVLTAIESHVLYPMLVGDRVGLHPLVVIIALFVGAEVLGIMGALLAVPITVVLQVLFDHFYTIGEQQPTPALQPVSLDDDERAVAPLRDPDALGQV